MSEWFKHISIYDRDTVRRRQRSKIGEHIRKYGEYRLDKDRATPKPVTIQLLYHSSVGKVAVIGGEETKVFGVSDIAKLYGINPMTPLRWYRDGALPKPYILRKIGGGHSPQYILLQMRVIVRVLNDVYQQGMKSICWADLEGHQAMMRQGNELAIEAFERRAYNSHKQRLGGEFGVIMEEDGSN